MIHPGQPEENFEELLEEFMPPDIDSVIREKEASDKNKEKSLQEILDSYPAPQDELDLHKLTSKQAEQAIHFFIENSHHNRLKTVRIITGKGTHSDEGKSVLRSIAEEKIIELKKRGLVLSFQWEQGKMAKSGAIIVYLK